MSETKPTNCPCIDPSPLYLWPLADALERFPVEAADSPQARRLAVLVAEAQAAGRVVDVLRVLASWATVLHQELDREQPGRSVLLHAIGAVEAVCFRGERSDQLEALLRELGGLVDFNTAAEEAAASLAVAALQHLEGSPHTPEQAWEHATELLSAIAAAAGDAADATIGRCAELAYGVLFPAR